MIKLSTAHRDYKVRTNGEDWEDIEGSFSFGSFDAAKQYAAKHLPGYECVPYGTSYSLILVRVTAINHETQHAEYIWVQSLN